MRRGTVGVKCCPGTQRNDPGKCSNRDNLIRRPAHWPLGHCASPPLARKLLLLMQCWFDMFFFVSFVLICAFITDDTACQTPEGTPVSDSSTDSSYTDKQALEQPHSTGAPQKRAVRSLSLDAGMTHTRLHILSCVRSVRDNIRSQISNSSPSSPVSRSM